MKSINNETFQSTFGLRPNDIQGPPYLFFTFMAFQATLAPDLY